jgi:WD40 repeat protein
MALGTEQGTVELWDLKTAQINDLGGRQSGPVTAISFTPGNRFLRITVKGRALELLWDLQADAELPLPFALTDSFAISTDGKALAGLGTNYLIKVWDLPGLRERMVLKGHRWTLACLAFSPDGKYLASGSLDALALLWDRETGQELTRPLRGHLQGVTSLAFSPDSRIVATGSTDGTVKLWHVPTGRELLSAADASSPLFSPDGSSLLLRRDDGLCLIHVPSLAEIDAGRQTESSER